MSEGQRRLVINADDLGLHPAIGEGILRAHRKGVVTSATLLATGTHAPQAVKAARAQGLPLGVHLCLTTRMLPAAPAQEVRSLIPGGRFRSSWSAPSLAWFRGELDLSEVERELNAQLERARALGAEVDHLDAHQHLHLLPGVSGVVVALAKREGLPLRIPKERPHFSWLPHPGAAVKSVLLTALSTGLPRAVKGLPAIGLFEAGRLDEATLLRVLDRLPPGDWELGCHPGLKDQIDVPEDPSWRYGWTQELSALTSGRVRESLKEHQIKLVDYGALFSDSKLTRATSGHEP